MAQAPREATRLMQQRWCCNAAGSAFCRCEEVAAWLQSGGGDDTWLTIIVVQTCRPVCTWLQSGDLCSVTGVIGISMCRQLC